MIAVGQQVKFDPFDCLTGYGVEVSRRKVTGTVVFVNVRHRWFSVAYDDGRSRISFHFADIGKKVKLLRNHLIAGAWRRSLFSPASGFLR